MEEDIEDSLVAARTIVEVLDEMKGENILLMDLIGICSFADYFVICTGTSDRMLKALSDDVQKKVKQAELGPIQSLEGEANSGWILHDYGDVILHLFSPQRREYYRLEELWGDGKVLLHIQ